MLINDLTVPRSCSFYSLPSYPLHIDHDGQGCECLSSDSTGAYVHNLSLAPCGRDSSTVAEELLTEGARDEDYKTYGVAFSQDCGSADLGTGHRGSVPFLSHRPGAYG